MSFKKKRQFLGKKYNFCQFKKKKSSFWQFFNSQRAIFRRVISVVITWCLGLPTIEGNTLRGASSPANPALHIPEPLSTTRPHTSPSPLILLAVGANTGNNHIQRQQLFSFHFKVSYHPLPLQTSY